MRLLWRTSDDESRPTSGPKRRLTVDEVVDAAIAIADERGDVSMRAVADRLGVTPMALYGYLPNKEMLLALMYDAIHADVLDPSRFDGHWRGAVIACAEELLDLYVAHPWSLQVSYARPVLGPNEQGMLERLVGLFRQTPIPPNLLRRALGMLLHAVRGTARTIAEAQEAARSTGRSEDEWWEEVSEAVSVVVPDFAERFPNTLWLFSAQDAGEEQPGSYVDRHSRENLRVGLELLLDGLEAAASRS
jgi:AcrR family transcriptional regulator